MYRRLEDSESIFISPLSMAEEHPDKENEAKIESHRKLLIALFAAYPGRNYFNSYEKYHVNGQVIKLRQSLLKRNKLIDGLSTPITKYDVLGIELAHGSYGVVYPVKGTLTLRRNNLSYEVDDNHVVKLSANFDTRMFPSLGLPAISETTPKQAFEEHRTMAEIGRFNPKKEATQQVGQYESLDFTLDFITTRRFTGVPLSSIIQHQHLTIEERVRLSIALLRALKEQIDDKGFIHRDIKPENIIVDLETMEVNIIDVGFSTPKKFPEVRPCGTPGYIAPEIFMLDRITEKADIFSMSRTLARLWGENLEFWKKMKNEELEDASIDFEFDASKLFQHPNKERFKDVDKKVKEYIVDMLEFSSIQNPHGRADVNILVSILEELYILVKHKSGNKELNDALHDAFDVGYNARPRLLVAPNGVVFFNTFDDALNNIPDDKRALDEFVHGLGWYTLTGVESKIELRERAVQIVNQYSECAQRYLQILEHAETIRNQLIVRNTGVSHELDEFILEITHKLKRINDKPFDLDALQKSFDRLNENANQWEARLRDLQNSERYQTIKKVVERLALPTDEPRPANQARFEAARLDPAGQQPNRELPTLETLKLHLMFAIRKYVRDTTTDRTIDKKKRAASKNRQKDIEDLTTIINSAETPDDLLKKTKARLSKMRFSLFGRSELRRNIEEVIKLHNAAMKIKK